MYNKNESFPAGTKDATLTLALNHKYKFTNVYGTLNRKLPDGGTSAYALVSQKVDVIFLYTATSETPAGATSTSSWIVK